MTKKIVIVPVDNSENSKRALKYAEEFCEKMNAEIVLVNVQQYPYTPRIHHFITKNEFEAFIKSSGEQVISETMEAVTNKDLIKEKLVLAGDPKVEITELAKKYNAENIIMGSRGLGPVKGAFLGSVSIGVLQMAPCPVVIVP